MRPEIRQDLATGHYNLGLLFDSTGRLKEAETAYGQALALFKQLAADFPSVPQGRQSLAQSQNALGLLLRRTGRPKEAEAALAAALALRKQLAADFPDQPDLRNDVAGTCVNLALLRLGQRDFEGAKGYLEQAMPHHESALKKNAGHPDYRR